MERQLIARAYRCGDKYDSAVIQPVPGRFLLFRTIVYQRGYTSRADALEAAEKWIASQPPKEPAT